jgi:GGDEF domain-containing protein
VIYTSHPSGTYNSNNPVADLSAEPNVGQASILMPSTESDCAAMLRDLCLTIAKRTAAADCDVTASIGCKTFRAPPESATEALQLAEWVMYEAKLRGKNRSEHCVRDTRAA